MRKRQSGLLFRSVPWECKLAHDAETGVETGLLTGYGSVFGNVDLGGDVIEPGAFAACLKARAGKPLPMLFGHDTMQPVGAWTELAEDQRGLRCTGKLTLAVQKAQEALALIKDGAIDGLSIGYAITESHTERADNADVRVITAAELYEISLVVVPMNQEARLESAKSLDEWAALRALDLTRRGYDFHEAAAIAQHYAQSQAGGADDRFETEFRARLARLTGASQ